MPLGIAALVSGVVFAFWTFGHDIIAKLQFAVAPEGAYPGWQQAILLAMASVVAGLVSSKFEIKKAIKLLSIFLGFWMIFSIVATKTVGADLFAVPIILASAMIVTLTHFSKLNAIDSLLTQQLVALATSGSKLPGNSPETRVETGLRLLETIFPLADVIVFNIDDEGELYPIGRTQKPGGASASKMRNQSWQDNVTLCEQAIEKRETIVRLSEIEENAARLALPLISEESVIGVLFIDIKVDYQSDDKTLLESFAGQLARNFQRNELKRKRLPHRNWWSYLSTQSSENRLNIARLVDEIIKEKSFGAAATSQLNEAHAVAYLDGTLLYLNTRIRELARIRDEEITSVNLFSLLERFRTPVFDEPGLAIRRVLQTGKSYSCELEFREEDAVLQLQIIPVKLPKETIGVKCDLAAEKPACLLITLQNIAAKKENERLRSDIAGLMSHELRTPITSINGFAEMLLMDGNIPEDSREYLSIISSESKRASQLLTNFLSVANLEQCDIKAVERAPVRLDNIVREVIEDLQGTAKKKRIRIVEKQSENIPPVSGDRGLITKAITQLVDNAIKYSPERTSVIISTILDSDFLSVVVEDRGYGIPSGEQEKIWQKFYRVAREGRDKEERSTGLGLSLVKEIIEQHNGEVEVESAVGRGSRFSFKLPRL